MCVLQAAGIELRLNVIELLTKQDNKLKLPLLKNNNRMPYVFLYVSQIENITSGGC